MSGLDYNFDFDLQISRLESEWRQAYEDSIVARADYQAMSSQPTMAAVPLEDARERLERAEAQKARIMLRIEGLEHLIAGRD